MAHAIADSDEEGDEITVAQTGVEDPEPNGRNRQTESAADGSNGDSTGSTEHLRRQIYSAERKFVSDSESRIATGPELGCSESPSSTTLKRNHTAIADRHNHPSSTTALKRTKSAKTYSATKRSHLADAQDADMFTPGDDLTTSQSATFSEHSGLHSSARLSMGSMREDFADHEPNVLFRDSGSTIVDGSATQHQLLAQAVERRAPTATPPASDLHPDDHDESSIPWSTLTGDAHSAHDSHEVQSKSNYTSTSNGNEMLLDALADESQRSERAGATSGATIEVPQFARSAVVEIQSVGTKSRADTARSVTAEQESSVSNKRKAQWVEQESDDTGTEAFHNRLSDLPVEQYKPRPSKRRATQIISEPVDFSLIPGRAAKSKRTKSTPAVEREPSKEANLARPTIQRGAVTTDTTTTASTDDQGEKADTEVKANASQDHISTAETPTETIPDELHKNEPHEETMPPPPRVNVQREQTNDQATKPSKASRKAKVGSGTKRAQTTIFEDLPKFLGSQRTPNLSQQQALRQSALEPIENGSTIAKRKRRTVVRDDEDEDEDELTKDPPKSSKTESEEDAAKKSDPPPIKRGRGRPPKSAAKVQDEDVDEPSDQPCDGSEVPKVNESALEVEVHEKIAETHPAAEDRSKRLITVDVETLTSESQARGATAKPTATDEPPECSPPVEEPLKPSPKKPQKPPKGSPTSHSPLKSTCKVALRVGLSKSQRIPSLLRTMNTRR